MATYSDGPQLEAQVIDRIARAGDRSADADLTGGLAGLPWAVRYHLDPGRANLLRPLAFRELSVLDLGAGMGGVTRFVAERAREVVAVEASPVRAEGLAERLRGCDGARVVVSTLEELALDRTFDVVMLIGVLEYAERWVDTPAGHPGGPFAFVLERAASFLAPDGVLLVAIENRLGLKFWTGAAEEHSGKLFDGVAGYPERPGARTFSRRELAALLAGAGLPPAEWLYPFPDYKLPGSVLAGRLMAGEPQLAIEIATSRPFRDPAAPRVELVPDSLVFAGLAGAGLAEEFANAFLVLASRAPGGRVQDRLRGDGSEVGWHFALGRREPVTTVFTVSGEGLRVAKRRAGGESGPVDLGAELAGLSWHGFAEQPLAQGTPLRVRLQRLLAFADTEGFLGELERFFTALSGRYRAGAEGDGLLAGEALDAGPQNTLVDEAGGYRSFDLEWRLDRPLPASWFVLRSVLSLADSRGRLPGGPTSLAELYAAICARLSLRPDLPADLRREVALAAAVLRVDRGRWATELESLLRAPFPAPTLLASSPSDVLAGLAGSAEAERRRWELLHRQLEERVEGISSRLAEVHDEAVALEGYARDLEARIERFEASGPGAEASPAPRPRVLAVVVPRGRSPRLAASLRAMLASRGVAIDVVVAHAAPLDLPGWTEREPRLHRLRVDPAMGRAAAANRAARTVVDRTTERRLVAPDYLFFCDPDATVRPDTLGTLIAALAGHPRAAAAGPTLVRRGSEETIDSLGLRVSEAGEVADDGRGGAAAVAAVLPAHEVLALRGAALLVRPESWNDLGGWSERYDREFEDLDLCLRARQSGWTVLQVPEATAVLGRTADPADDPDRRLVRRDRWSLLLVHWPLRSLLRHRRGLLADRPAWRDLARRLPGLLAARHWLPGGRPWLTQLAAPGTFDEPRRTAGSSTKAQS